MRFKRTYSLGTFLILAPLLPPLSSWIWHVCQDHSVRAKLDTDANIVARDTPIYEVIQQLASDVEIEVDVSRIDEQSATRAIVTGAFTSISTGEVLTVLCHCGDFNYTVENGRIQLTAWDDPDGEIPQENYHRPQD